MSEKSAKSSPFVERFEKLAKSSPFVERGAETVVAVGQSDAPVVVVVVELTLNVSKLAVHSKRNILKFDKQAKISYLDRPFQWRPIRA